MGTQHSNRHRRFEPPHDMRPGAPETLEALDEARVPEGLGRWSWESNGRVFQVEMQRLPAGRPPERTAAGRMWQAAELIREGMLSVEDFLDAMGVGPTPAERPPMTATLARVLSDNEADD